MTEFALAITPSVRARRHGHLTAHPHRSEFARRRVGGGRVGGAKVTSALPVVLARRTIRGLICSNVGNNFVGG